MELPYIKGFTLLELLVTVTLSVVLLTIGLPNFQHFTVQTHLTQQTNRLSQLLNAARVIAINEQTTTIVCPTSDFKTCSDNWNEVKMFFVDLNQNRQVDEDDRQLGILEEVTRAYFMSGPASPIRYAPTGATATPATVELCHLATHSARATIVSLQGRVRIDRQRSC